MIKTPRMAPQSPTEWQVVEPGLEAVPPGLEPVPVIAGMENVPYQQRGSYVYQYMPKDQLIAGYVTSAGAKGREKEMICGLRKQKFFLSFIFALLIIGGALAGGLAGGLSSRGATKDRGASQSSSPLPSSSTSPNTSIHIATTLTASTAAGPSVTTSATSPLSTGPGGVQVECPDANNTYASIAGSSQRFYRLCNTDFNGNVGSIDIAYIVVHSFTECMQKCLDYNLLSPSSGNCSGVSWRWQGLPGTDYNYCYIKSQIGATISLTNVEAAYLQ